MADQLRDDEHNEVGFVGMPDSLEARLADEAGLDFFPVRAKGYDRAAPLSIVGALFTSFGSWLRCLGLLRAFKPDVVVGFGGYVALPLCSAALFTGVPVVVHEQNAVPGMVNRWLSYWAAATCLTFPESVRRMHRRKRAVVTGNPVRTQVLAADRARGRKSLKLRAKDKVMLVVGGSRGARHLNYAALALYPRLSKVRDLKVVHVAGPAEYEDVKARFDEVSGGKAGAKWRVLEYIDEMGDALAAADLVVSRAGASSIGEITAVGRAAILVPFPFATDDHQDANARWVEAPGAAVVVADEDLDSPLFGDTILAVLEDDEGRGKMAAASHALGRGSAAAAVAEVVIDVGAARRRRLGMAGDAPEPAEETMHEGPVRFVAVPEKPQEVDESEEEGSAAEPEGGETGGETGDEEESGEDPRGDAPEPEAAQDEPSDEAKGDDAGGDTPSDGSEDVAKDVART